MAPEARRAEEWALVLAALGIPHAVHGAEDGWALVVAPHDARRASAALSAYDEENREAPPDEAIVAAGPAALWIGLTVAGVLLAFFLVTGPRAAGSHWFSRGSADSERILAGEAWRAVTALTLHADAGHVLGNALACVVLVTAVAQTLGGGVGLAAMVLAGTAGNWLTAMAHGPGHDSVGASTLTFGALGILAGCQVVVRLRHTRRRGRAWVVVVACLILLLLLGSTPGADVVAHALGLATGAVLGLAAGLVRRPAPAVVQRRLGSAALAVVLLSWALA